MTGRSHGRQVCAGARRPVGSRDNRAASPSPCDIRRPGKRALLSPNCANARSRSRCWSPRDLIEMRCIIAWDPRARTCRSLKTPRPALVCTPSWTWPAFAFCFPSRFCVWTRTFGPDQVRTQGQANVSGNNARSRGLLMPPSRAARRSTTHHPSSNPRPPHRPRTTGQEIARRSGPECSLRGGYHARA